MQPILPIRTVPTVSERWLCDAGDADLRPRRVRPACMT